MKLKQDIEHILIHIGISILDTPASLLFALLIEIGDEIKHRRNPVRHVEGFDIRDFIARAIGPIVLLILGWNGFFFELF